MPQTISEQLNQLINNGLSRMLPGFTLSIHSQFAENENLFCVCNNIEIPRHCNTERTIQAVVDEVRKSVESSNIVTGIRKELNSTINKQKDEIAVLKTQVGQLKKFETYYKMHFAMSHGKSTKALGTAIIEKELDGKS